MSSPTDPDHADPGLLVILYVGTEMIDRGMREACPLITHS
jgi:hypothetical protein